MQHHHGRHRHFCVVPTATSLQPPRRGYGEYETKGTGVLQLRDGETYCPPHSRNLPRAGASALPDSVSRYSSRGGCCLYRRRRIPPASSSFLRRIVSVSRGAPVL